MRGQVISHNSREQYGFVHCSESGESYRFNYSSCDRETQTKLTDGCYVSFTKRAVQDGYEAVHVSFINSDLFLYELPSKLLVTQGMAIPEWIVIDGGDWTVIGSSEESPAKAKQQCMNLCRSVGANGALKLTYSVSQGRKGNYRYSVHHYSAVPVRIARKSPIGRLRNHQVGRLSASITKSKLAKKTRTSRLKALGWYVLAIGGALLTDNPFVLLGGLILCLWFVRVTHYDDWLKPNLMNRSSMKEWESV